MSNKALSASCVQLVCAAGTSSGPTHALATQWFQAACSSERSQYKPEPVPINPLLEFLWLVPEPLRKEWLIENCRVRCLIRRNEKQEKAGRRPEDIASLQKNVLQHIRDSELDFSSKSSERLHRRNHRRQHCSIQTKKPDSPNENIQNCQG